jgi:hypothetical protein
MYVCMYLFEALQRGRSNTKVKTNKHKKSERKKDDILYYCAYTIYIYIFIYLGD